MGNSFFRFLFAYNAMCLVAFSVLIVLLSKQHAYFHADWILMFAPIKCSCHSNAKLIILYNAIDSFDLFQTYNSRTFA